MKRILLLALTLLAITQVQSQREYDDLLELIVDENYQRCLTKAEKYTLSDATKKDPLPYLYMSMAYFEIARGEDEKLKELYEGKAFKNSLKYASKYSKKDKQREYYAEFVDFFVDLRKMTYEEAENFDMEEKYTKSKGFYKYLTTIDPNDPGAWLYKGFTEYALKAKRDAGESFDAALAVMSEQGLDHLEEDQKERLMLGLMKVAEFLDAKGEGTRAEEIMEAGKGFFGDDDSYMQTYKEIVG